MTAHHKITVMDGAMGTALRARGVRVPNYKSSIWSAQAILDAPYEIINLHADYIRAGADMITTNNYAVTRPILTRENMGDRFEEMLTEAIKLAVAARNRVGRTGVKIAVSLPPLSTSYRADLVGSFQDNLEAYREIVVISAPLVDMFVCETMTTTEEARAAATAGCESGLPVYVSWTLSPAMGDLRGGESPTQAVKALDSLPVAGFLFNCSACSTVSLALKALAQVTDKPVGAYCNPVMHEPVTGGEPEHIPTTLLSAQAYAEVAKDWIASGATLIGGCCDTDPSYIEALSALK